MPYEFPRQDIPESQKNLDWCKKVIDYAIDVHDRRMQRVARKQTRLWGAYNGKVNRSSIHYLTNTYGKSNNVKFIDYRLATPKINLIHGEFLSLPLRSHVETVNEKARTEKMEKYQALLGLSAAEEQVRTLREDFGYEVMDGMEAPSMDDEDGWAKLEFKIKNEIAMQAIVDDQVNNKNIRNQFADNFLDVEVISECHGKVESDAYGKVTFRDIDARNAIYVESERDMFCQRSPIRGERILLFPHEILNKWGHVLSDKQRDKVYEFQRNPQHYKDNYFKGHEYYHMVDGQLQVECYMVEWASVTPYRRKVVPDPKGGAPFKKNITNEFYEKNKRKIQREVKKGKYEIETKWREEWWEGLKVGDDIYIECKKKENQYLSVDFPSENMSDYCSFLMPSRDGVRISLMELLENISHVYNIVMFQINRELAKAKGKVIAYDLAYLPKGKKINDVLYNITNDSLYFYNSSEDGRVNEGEAANIPGLKEADLGVSNAVQHLIALKMELQATADRLTGINESRQGLTKASATATASQADLAASRTITFPMFFFFGKYQEHVMKKICEKSKILIGNGHSEAHARMILGDKIYNYIKVTKDIRNYDYGLHMTDGKKEQDIKARLMDLSMAAVNARELRVQDVMKAELSETLAEAEQVLENAWEKIKDREESIQKQQIEQQNQTLQANLQGKTEEREDHQAHDRDMAILEAELETGKIQQEGGNKVALQQQQNLGKLEQRG